MSFEIKPATRQGIIPLLGLWGGTGGGKTESALRLARGIAGAKGRLGVVDTEGRRASYYVDRIPGGFNAIDFAAPYTPERYIEALDVLESQSDVGVVDSASHCWEGPDGILDLHEQALDRMCGDKRNDWKERDRLNWPAWREPKARWKVLRNRLLAFKIPLIICFRGEPKTHMEKKDGRNTVVTDLTTSPIFDKRFIFEVHVAIECFQINGSGGYVRFPQPYAKTSHADIRKLLPEEGKEQLSIDHGAALAKWCASPGGPQGEPDPRKALLSQLWAMTKSIRGTDKTWGPFEGWAIAKAILSDTEAMIDLPIARIQGVLEETKKVLAV